MNTRSLIAILAFCAVSVFSSAGSKYMDGLIDMVVDNESKAELTAAKNDVTLPKRDRNILILNVMMKQPAHDAFFIQLLNEQSKQARRNQLAQIHLKLVEPELVAAYNKLEELKLDMEISDYQQEQEERFILSTLTKRQRQTLETIGTDEFGA
ncbi:hypothetical protein QR680_000941 [Steinernema hermaphroditum]|uniref:Zinc resistance-associated protein n=1 Tax=Steinernema hermaphroditum TaxID=289476 RepID=A0AA39LEZ1_9BILA|nr:hypothetical protein QR680_000941 [Steinernema hermaphroditum]